MTEKMESTIDPVALQEIVAELNQKIKYPHVFLYEGMNWLHPININIAHYYRHAAIHASKPVIEKKGGSPVPTLAFKIRFKCSEVIRKYQAAYRYYRLLSTINGYKKRVAGNPLNFLQGNYNACYNGKYFNTFGDNINLTEKNVTGIFLSGNGYNKSQQAFYTAKIINPWILTYLQHHKIKSCFPAPFINFLETHLEAKVFVFVKDTLQRTYHYYCFFLWLLNEWKPSKIYLYDSYNEFSLGLIGAAKKLKIKVIEQQHGIIYPTHYGYQYQYEKIGDSFICDELHYYTEPLFHTLKTRWKYGPLLKYINHSPNYVIWEKYGKGQKSESISNLQLKAGTKKIVSFGLTTYHIPDWLVNTLTKLDSTEEYFFCFRSHPRHHKKLVDQLRQLEISLTNLDHEICSEVALFDLLNISQYFLSDGSSTLIDALEFNLPAACFNELFAEAIFEPYIQQGEMALLKEPDQFIEFLSTGKNKIA